MLSLRHLPLATVNAVLQVTPLAVTAGAALLYGEQVGWRRWLAALTGFAGVLLIVKPGGGFGARRLYAADRRCCSPPPAISRPAACTRHPLDLRRRSERGRHHAGRASWSLPFDDAWIDALGLGLGA